MKLGFEETQAKYSSGSQNARVWTERWIVSEVFCPNCGAFPVAQFAANSPVADFSCSSCKEEYELKSQKGRFGRRVVDGAFRTMSQRLLANNNPNLFLLNYDLAKREVTNLVVIPKQFFVPDVVEKRKPLAATARRAGWIGCNILLSQIPDIGKIRFLHNGIPTPKELVLHQWQKTLFLREEGIEARGWLIETMKCVDLIGKAEFGLDEVYAFERRLSGLYPGNKHVREKIRQQLQVLRDKGYLEFLSRGHYRLRRN
jgi:type II restriction enzyme